MTKCFSVRLQSFYAISPKCYKAVAFDGSEALIPASQYYGPDYDVSKSEAHWISAWILERKDLQYSTKKEAWFYTDTKKMAPTFHFEKHVPTKKQAKQVEPPKELKR